MGFRGAFGKVAHLGAERGGRNTDHAVPAFGQGLGGGRVVGNLSKGRDTSYPSSKIMFCKHRDFT